MLTGEIIEEHISQSASLEDGCGHDGFCDRDAQDSLVGGSIGGGDVEYLSSDYSGYVWQSTTIKYSFDVGSFGYGEFSSYYQTVFESAMSQWSAVTNLTFVEADIYSADLVMLWDPQPDGYRGVLGWAAPYDADGDKLMENGQDIYYIGMDPYDTWSFYTTAIHEVGHSLGLSHINHTASIMGSYYNGAITGLTSYDIQAIQQLYGIKGDTIVGGSGTDSLAGNDHIIGSSSADRLSGGDGSDTISGNAGNDLIYGNRNTDYLDGGSGNDTIYAGQNDGSPRGTPLAMRDGVDTVYGGSGSDRIYGNHGPDLLYGGSGWDTMYGGQDEDTIYGGSDSDRIFGNLGNDLIYGEAGYDTIYGGDGDDTIVPGGYLDYIYGNGGTDTYLIEAGANINYIFGYEAGEKVQIADGMKLSREYSSYDGSKAYLFSGSAGTGTVIFKGMTNPTGVVFEYIL